MIGVNIYAIRVIISIPRYAGAKANAWMICIDNEKQKRPEVFLERSQGGYEVDIS